MSDEVKLDAYQIDGYTAPSRCETCNHPLPDEPSRRKHMKETSHRLCSACDKYVPLGGFYGHVCMEHPEEAIFEHMAAWTDRKDDERAQLWTRKKN
ncbi:hypothetical protein N7478_011581 [Penicillium angulare]|uniref:uncharacterized protein n=1 Tax=Penicillium angulare TaxID=116970 RepID=UPI0025420FE9|nr:uncharacterized protein N7478_011581 [Penicillium angulare]KAJ5260986.1 hypothetical protein N7478_011581 [Penicillium angulare]